MVHWHRGEVVIVTAELHSTKPGLRFGAGSNPVRSVSEIRDSEDLWQWSRLEIRLNAFCRSTIPQKQFITIFIIIMEIQAFFLQICVLKVEFSKHFHFFHASSLVLDYLLMSAMYLLKFGVLPFKSKTL